MHQTVEKDKGMKKLLHQHHIALAHVGQLFALIRPEIEESEGGDSSEDEARQNNLKNKK